MSCSVIEFSVSVAKHLSVISSMSVLLKEFVEVCSKESNVTTVLCCLRLVIFSSEVEKFLFSSGATAPAALEPLLEGGRYMSGWAVHLINPLNPKLNPICYLLALLGAHHFLHVSRIRVKLLTFRQLMSYIYGAPILDVSISHTTTQHGR